MKSLSDLEAGGVSEMKINPEAQKTSLDNLNSHFALLLGLTSIGHVTGDEKQHEQVSLKRFDLAAALHC